MKQLFSSIGRYFHETDRWLYLFCMLASGYSVLILSGIAYAGTTGYRQIVVQAVATLIGLTAVVVMSKIDYRFMAKLWKIHLPITLGLVLLTLFIGVSPGDTDDHAWLSLFGGKLFLQPAELLKISFILTFALHLEKVKDHINKPLNVLLLCLHGGIPVLLIHEQGDDGSALVFLGIFLCMFFAAGLSWKYIVAGLTTLAIACPIVWKFIMSTDQKNRFLAVYAPDQVDSATLWQQMMGIRAIGAGGLFGKGLFSGEHTDVPMIYNDFIFAYIGEALGFVGAVAALALLTAICGRILLNSRQVEDQLGKYICVGVFSMFAVQTFINVGMCLNLIPVIGITMPFFSAGGSSVVALYLGIGLAMSVYMHNKKNLFTDS